MGKQYWQILQFTCNNNLNCCDNYIVLIVFNSVSGNNQIGFDLSVDNLKTGKVRNTFPTTYGELDIFQVSLPHFTRGASWLWGELSWFQIMLSGSKEATNTNFIIFGLIQSRFESTTYHTWGEHAKHWHTLEFTPVTTDGDAVPLVQSKKQCLDLHCCEKIWHKAVSDVEDVLLVFSLISITGYYIHCPIINMYLFYSIATFYFTK
jgi:hypothetical protein